MKRVVFSLCILLAAAALPGQSVGVRDFFRLALPTDPGLPPAAFPRLRTPFIEAFDLRTETDRFDPARQEYTFRLQFATPALGRAQRALYETLLRAPDLDREAARCAVVEDLYGAWIQLYRTQRETELTDSLQRVLEDRQRLYTLELGRLRLPYDDLMDLRTAQTDHLLRSRELSREQESLRLAFGLADDQLEFEALPSPETIAGWLRAAEAAPLTDPERDYELALIDREIELERAEERGLLDFLQFRYRGNPNDEMTDRFHVGLALRFQNSGDRHLKVRALQLERQWVETNGTLADQLRIARRQAASVRLAATLERYAETATALTVEAKDLRQLATAALREEGADPELLLDIERRRLRNLLTLLEREEEVFREYLDWRERRGELCLGSDGRWLLAE